MLAVSNPLNVTYISGFTGDSSWLLLARDRTVVVSDGRYEVQISEECPGLEAIIRRYPDQWFMFRQMWPSTDPLG